MDEKSVMTKLKVATSQYDISFFTQWSDFADKLTHWVRSASEHQSKFLVLPEYGSMELPSLFGEKESGKLSISKAFTFANVKTP